MTTNDILTDDQIDRAVYEVIAASSPGGTDEDRIFAAIDDLRRLAISAQLFRTWEENLTVIGWDLEQQTLRFWIRGQQPHPLPALEDGTS